MEQQNMNVNGSALSKPENDKDKKREKLQQDYEAGSSENSLHRKSSSLKCSSKKSKDKQDNKHKQPSTESEISNPAQMRIPRSSVSRGTQVENANEVESGEDAAESVNPENVHTHNSSRKNIEDLPKEATAFGATRSYARKNPTVSDIRRDIDHYLSLSDEERRADATARVGEILANIQRLPPRDDYLRRYADLSLYRPAREFAPRNRLPPRLLEQLVYEDRIIYIAYALCVYIVMRISCRYFIPPVNTAMKFLEDFVFDNVYVVLQLLNTEKTIADLYVLLVVIVIAQILIYRARRNL